MTNSKTFKRITNDDIYKEIVEINNKIENLAMNISQMNIIIKKNDEIHMMINRRIDQTQKGLIGTIGAIVTVTLAIIGWIIRR